MSQPGVAAPLPIDTVAFDVWRDMGNELNWSALPVLIDVYDVCDAQALIQDLCAMRDHINRMASLMRND